AGWFDPIEEGIRGRVREFIEELVEAELNDALGRSRYQRPGTADSARGAGGYRHGRRDRQLLGSFGPVTFRVPRARLANADGTSQEWRSQVLPRYARMTRQVEALIAGAYLSGTNTRRVRRALGALFKGAVSKDTVSRTWRKVQADWQAWCRRSLADEDVVRLVLDGTVVRVRLDRKATSISLLVVLGIRRDGQKLQLAVRNMGGESEAAWRGVLDDLVARGLHTPRFLIIDGAAGLERALAALWPDVPTQRCTVHKHRNLLAHAPEALHGEVSADYTDMIYAATSKEVETRRRAFLRKWRLRCPAVAVSLEEAGERLFTFTRLPCSQWRSARTTNAIERLHEEFKRRIKTQTVLPSADTAAMLFWALLASGQIVMRKVDGWQTLAEQPSKQVIDLAA
ncbi:MAG: IS256 family transposase, partial [Acetobacteraceae bacterium]